MPWYIYIEREREYNNPLSMCYFRKCSQTRNNISSEKHKYVIQNNDGQKLGQIKQIQEI